MTCQQFFLVFHQTTELDPLTVMSYLHVLTDCPVISGQPPSSISPLVMTYSSFRPLLILVLNLSSTSAVLGDRCEDCNTVVTGLQSAALSNESIAMQQGMILSMVRQTGPDISH